MDKAYKAKKSILDYVFTDGNAENCVERTFVENLDSADEVVVYAKLPKGFHIPTSSEKLFTRLGNSIPRRQS